VTNDWGKEAPDRGKRLKSGSRAVTTERKKIVQNYLKYSVGKSSVSGVKKG